MEVCEALPGEAAADKVPKCQAPVVELDCVSQQRAWVLDVGDIDRAGLGDFFGDFVCAKRGDLGSRRALVDVPEFHFNTEGYANKAFEALGVARSRLVRAEGLHNLWSIGGQKTNPAKAREKLKSDMKICRSKCASFMIGFSAHVAALRERTAGIGGLDALVKEEKHVLEECGRYQGELLSNLASVITNLAAKLDTAARQCKKTVRDNGVKKHKAFAEVLCHNGTSRMSWDDATNEICEREACGERFLAWTACQYAKLVDILEVVPGISLHDLLVAVPHRPGPVPAAFELAKEVVEFLPVVVLALHPVTGVFPMKRIVVMPIGELGFRGAGFFWSVLHMSKGFAENIDTDFELRVEGPEPGPEVIGDEVECHTRRGRPRLEEKYGNRIVDFVRDFIHSHGQMALPDKHRLRTTGAVLGAPLEKIAKAARAAGFQVSRSGIFNLLAPSRQNAKHTTQRAVINARPARLLSSEVTWHPRDAFSSTLLKYDKQFVVESCSKFGCSAFFYNGDDMAQIPLLIPARQGSCLRGIVLGREGGAPCITAMDHNFPVAERLLIATSGWVQCQLPVSDIPVGEKPVVPLPRPHNMHAFVRVVRYTDITAEVHVRDLRASIETDHGDALVDFIVLGVDNGTDYAVSSPVLQHHLYRIWRERGCAMLVANAHSPGRSGRHVEIEQQWTQPRGVIAGQHFGFSAYDSGVPQLHGPDREVRLQEIASAGVREYIHLVQENCKTGGRPWHVEIRGGDADESVPDQAVIREMYSTTKTSLAAIRAMAGGEKFGPVTRDVADLARHIVRLPSSVAFQCCTGDLCSDCVAVTQRRRRDNPEWHPRQCLALLEANGFQRWFPTKQIVVPEVDDTMRFMVDVQAPPSATPPSRSMGLICRMCMSGGLGSARPRLWCPQVQQVARLCSVAQWVVAGSWHSSKRRCGGTSLCIIWTWMSASWRRCCWHQPLSQSDRTSSPEPHPRFAPESAGPVWPWVVAAGQ